jgi:poly-gamma-glutamate synthesis protein (capsule biosynthesis protein)
MPPLSLVFLGDLMLGRGVSRALPQRGPAWFWGDTLPLLRAADAVIANLESPITTAEARAFWKFFHFRARPDAVEILTAGGVRCVSLANNHAMDYGPAGLADTLAALGRAGIAHAGAGPDLAAASAPALFDVARDRIGFIAATDRMPEFAAGPHAPGTHAIAIGGAADAAALAPALQRVRAAGATLIVLALHWGPNMRSSQPDRYRAFARAAIEAGVDIVHGHSAHLTHGVERHGAGLILHDTGNFIDDYIKFPFLPDDWSFVFQVSRGSDGRLDLALVPVRLHPSPLRVMTGPQSAKRRRRMIEASARLGSRLDDRDGTLHLA